MYSESPRQFIKDAALSVGFDDCGVARADFLAEDARYLRQWLGSGKHADMRYMERNLDKRTDPRLLVAGCKTVVVVAMNYYTDEKQPYGAPQIAKYAFPEIDYHTVLKEKLALLEAEIVGKLGEEAVNKTVQHIFVDSAPVLERRWAERAGLGWIGKNKMLISPAFGSYVFLGVLMLNFELPDYDNAIENQCVHCNKCIKACPNQALTDNGIDCKRCISYHTIENKGSLPENFILQNFIIGCDICNDICPWNKNLALKHTHLELTSSKFVLTARWRDWEEIEKPQFSQLFKKSALSHCNFTKVKRNVLKLKKVNGNTRSII